jgi:hypothetical protein
VEGFRISGAEPSGSVTTVFVSLEYDRWQLFFVRKLASASFGLTIIGRQHDLRQDILYVSQ